MSTNSISFAFNPFALDSAYQIQEPVLAQAPAPISNDRNAVVAYSEDQTDSSASMQTDTGTGSVDSLGSTSAEYGAVYTDNYASLSTAVGTNIDVYA